MVVRVDVYLPARMYIGKLGAVLATYLASAMLHVSHMTRYSYSMLVKGYFVISGFEFPTWCSAAFYWPLCIHRKWYVELLLYPHLMLR
jgi:hypothetical protein